MIYLDHAATSYPKPPAVIAAVQRWFTEVGVSADRGDGPRTRDARGEVQRTRGAVAHLVGMAPSRVAFVSGATEGLNLVLRALCRPGSRVLTTPFEHSSVVRPLLALAGERNLTVEVRGATPDGCPDDQLLLTGLRDAPPGILVFTHASNVTGAVFDARTLCEEARRHGVTTVLDASQTAGLLPLDVGADVIVASAHKALHGPPGIGFVAVRSGLDLPPQKQGGTGSSTALDRHPDEWPTAFEAGTPNTPAIYGLGAACSWLSNEGPGALLARALRPLERLRAELRRMPGVRLPGDHAGARVPVLSLVHDRYDPLELAALLSGREVHARAGFHCAPWVHRVLGSDAAGTLRFSTGPATLDADVQVVVDLMRTL